MTRLRKAKGRTSVWAVMASASLAIMAASLAAQTAAASAQASLQSAAQPVSLDVSVRGKHNRPAVDLKPDQVMVADNGQPATLTGVQLVNGKSTDAPLITLLFDRPGMDIVKKGSEDVLFGTSPYAAREISRTLCEAASRFLKGFPVGEFQFAVFDVWGRLQTQHEFTTNRKSIAESIAAAVEPQAYGSTGGENQLEQLMAQVAETGQNGSGAIASGRERALARSLYAAMQASKRIAAAQHLPPSQASLLALIQAQQSLPGRKAIVYFMSSQIEAPGGNAYRMSARDTRARDELKSIMGAANRAGVNVYVVLPDTPTENSWDPMGMFSTTPKTVSNVTTFNNPKQQGNPGPGGPNPRPNGPTTSAQDPDIAHMEDNYAELGSQRVSRSDFTAFEGMAMLARGSGGAVMKGTGNMRGPLKDLAQNLTNYYAVSFVPAAGADDGSFHTVRFRTSRRELKIHAQTGYLAMPANAESGNPPQPFEVLLMGLLQRSELPHDLDYRDGVIHLEHMKEGSFGLAGLEVPASALETRTDATTHLSSARVSVLATIRDSTGKEVERFGEDIARRWSTEISAGTAPEYISFERTFAAPPGAYVLETAVLDQNSGKAAAKRQTFEISASRTTPELSDLMLVRGIQPADSWNSEPDLFWRDERRVLPNLYGELPVGTHEVSIFFVAHTEPRSPATVKLEVLRNGVLLPGGPLTSTLKAGDEFRRVLDGLSIRSAADGKYEVRVTLTRGETAVERTVGFVLSGDGEPTVSGAATTDNAPIAINSPHLELAEPNTGRPTQEEIDRVLADARRNALGYADALPNLMCRQTTQRLNDAGNGDWRLRDTFVEELTYVNHQEKRVKTGRQITPDEPDFDLISTGEFGYYLANIFKPEAKTVFAWKETSTLNGEPVEVFDYHVKLENSQLLLIAPEAAARTGYHGEIYVDRAAHGVRSLTAISDKVPEKFPIRKTAVRVDYDYVTINDHDYLLPVSAQVITRLGGETARRNDLEFNNYRRFGSTVRIIGVGGILNPEDPE
ncbi:MAG: VWA domain-containing protein [Acidobacteriaceae bacterium]